MSRITKNKSKAKTKAVNPEEFNPDLELPIAEISMEKYTHDCIMAIGKYTMEDRAVPDFRDGLKPVQRRILWSMIDLGINDKNVKKCARIVGDVLGRFHPHGDSAVYDALVNMATKHNTQLIYPSGNFGNMGGDEAAAQRYTEARLTSLAMTTFVDPDYLAVVPRIDNFDGEEKEPLYLPSKLPIALTNSASGILFGGVCENLAFTIPSVIELTKRALKGDKITTKLCAKILEPVSAYGSEAYLEDEEGESYKEYLSTGRGAVYWIPKYDVDVASKSVRIYGFPPPEVKYNIESTFNSIAKLDTVASIEETHNKKPDPVTGRQRLAWTVKLNSSVKKADVEDELLQVTSFFEKNQKLRLVLNERKIAEDSDGKEHTVDMLTRVNIPQVIDMWLKYRIQLERDVITLRTTRAQKQLDRQEMYLLMVLNRALILKALDADDSEAILMKKLKITREQAEFIMDCKIRTLKALNEKPIRVKIKELKDQIKQYKKDHKDPTSVINNSLDKIMEVL